MRHCDARMTVARLKPLIDCLAVGGHRNRSIVVALCGRSGDFPNAPRKAIILGHDDGLIAIRVAYWVRRSSARIVRHVNGSIGRDFEMAVQPTAVSGRKHDRSGAEGPTAIEAQGGGCICDALRGVVDGVRGYRIKARKWGMEWATADRFVVYT